MAREHGLPATYITGKCRCELCTKANAAAHRTRCQRRAARLAANPSLAAHGKASTYRNWGCRCQPCTAANTAACQESGRRWRERQRELKAGAGQ